MVTLFELLTDFLCLIFTPLDNIDLLLLLISRRVCRAFQAVVTDILTNTITNHIVAIHTLPMSHFLLVFDSSKAGAEFQPRSEFSLGYAPFYSLPWASNSELRVKYLGKEARRQVGDSFYWPQHVDIFFAGYRK
jgi:hypothetical protein